MNERKAAIPVGSPGRMPGTPLPWTAGVLGLVAVGLAVRVATLPTVPDVDDSFRFVRGVVRFSLAEGSPHWPGYPVYIWVGKLAHAVVGDPIRALHLVSAIASALVAWPLGYVTRAWALSLEPSPLAAAWSGWAAAALWLVTPVSWVTGSQIVSDPLGLLCGMTVLACCVGGERAAMGRWMGAAAIAGMMIGVRLVNVSMLGPLVWKSWRARKERWRGVRLPLALLIALLAGALPWISWLALREPAAFLQGGRSHLGGHFGRWGESLVTDEQPLKRPLRAGETLATYGLGAGLPRLGWPRVLVGGAWLTIVVVASAARPWRTDVAGLVALWAVPHVAYLFFAHDVALPRYMFPAVSVLSLLAGVAVAVTGRVGQVAVAVAIAATAAVSAPLTLRQRRQPPADYRAAEFLKRQPRAAVVVVNAPLLPLYLQEIAPAVASVTESAAEIPTRRARWEAEGRQVFATVPPPEDPHGWRPVAHFCGNPLIDPRLGHDIWLFAPVSSEMARPVLDCGEE